MQTWLCSLTCRRTRRGAAGPTQACSPWIRCGRRVLEYIIRIKWHWALPLPFYILVCGWSIAHHNCTCTECNPSRRQIQRHVQKPRTHNNGVTDHWLGCEIAGVVTIIRTSLTGVVMLLLSKRGRLWIVCSTDGFPCAISEPIYIFIQTCLKHSLIL